MSEITPNTPNPVREDAYVEELATKLGIEPQYIPKSPVWRNEEEIRAIAEMFANMQGGGSSGGGVLVVNMTWNGSTATADKTASEIYNAAQSGVVAFKEDDGEGYAAVGLLYSVRLDHGAYEFCVGNGEGCYVFAASSGSEYPEYIAG